jgi:hypothetical protein
VTHQGQVSAGTETDPDRPLSEDLRRAAPVAARGGLVVAAAAIVIGQIPPLATNVFGGGLAISTQLRMGWLYTAASNAVAIRIGELSESGAELERFGTATLRLALLTVTFALGWLLVRAGAGSAGRVTDRPGRRALAGSLVAPSYAAVMVPFSLLVELRLSTGGGFFPDVTTFSAVPWESFVLPFLLAAATGAVGGLRAGSGIRTRWWEAVAGGWRAFVGSLILAFVGLLVFAALRPSGLEGYVDQLRSLGLRGGALVVGHQALLLPDQAVLTLVPAMGACDIGSGPDVTSDVLCLDRQPAGDNPLDTFSITLGEGPIPTRSLPAIARLFLLVPLVAVAVGARRGVAKASSNVDAVIRGVCAGVVFAAFVVVAAWASTVTIRATQEQDGVVSESTRVTLGARPLEAGLYALAWGISVGGVAGLATFALKDRRASPA